MATGRADTDKIDKNKVKRNFSNAANYDNFTSYHNLTLEMTFVTIKNYFDNYDKNKTDAPIIPKNILDIGCGTGQGYLILKKIMSNYNFNYFGLDFAFEALSRAKRKLLIPDNANNVSLICADAESLPLTHKKFDIIFSNMTLHWLNNIGYFLNSTKSILKDGGIIILSFLIDGTLKELLACFTHALSKEEDSRLHSFFNLAHIKNKISESGLKIIDSKVFEYIETADSSQKLLKKINMLGAKNAVNSAQISHSLLKQVLNEYDKCYRNFNDKVYATYKIAYLTLKKNS
ncbi:MAG: methyltransferase domain-containing protein [Deltaproteobacteria bacterium]|nr:methyltransferase domain-containing protein [Deltaproteobacteria bacterium]